MYGAAYTPPPLPLTQHIEPHGLYRTITSAIIWAYRIFCSVISLRASCRFITTDIELDELKHRNIINYVKAQRLSWFGHIHTQECLKLVL